MKDWYLRLSRFRQATPLTPSEQIWANKKEFGFLFHIWTFFLLLPFALIQVYNERFVLALLIGAVALQNIFVVYSISKKDIYPFNGWGLLILCCLAVLYASRINGIMGTLWAFPLMAAFFFLLRLHQAIIGVILYLLIQTMVVADAMELTLAIRIIGTLTLTSVIMGTFAWLLDEQQRNLYQLATTDTLTGCGNRMKLNDSLEEAIYLHHRYHTPYSLIVLDIDHFKQINDQYGHSVGDKVLVEFAGCLQSRVRMCDHLYRYGGEEFMILLPNTRLKDAAHLAEDLRLAVSVASFSCGQVTLSAGIAELVDGESWDHWMNRADQAMYAAKQAGRNRVNAADAPVPPAP